MPQANSARASALLDEARAALAALAGPRFGGTLGDVAAAAERRLVWAGQRLDEPYVPAPPHAAARREARAVADRLGALTDAFEELVEAFEDEDPLANANGVQAGSLAFAIVGAAASHLRRLLAGEVR